MNNLKLNDLVMIQEGPLSWIPTNKAGEKVNAGTVFHFGKDSFVGGPSVGVEMVVDGEVKRFFYQPFSLVKLVGISTFGLKG